MEENKFVCENGEQNMERTIRDPYREWSYQDRVDAGYSARYSDDYDERRELRRACDKYDADMESGDRAYDSWRNGGEFSDPNPDGRFH